MAEDEAERLFEEGTNSYGGGMYQQALDACDKAQAILDPNSFLASGVWTLRGLVLNDLGRYQEAVESFNNAIAIAPDYEVAWSGKATALLHLGRYKESVKSFDKYLALDPSEAMAWMSRGAALSRIKQHEEAQKSFLQAYKLDLSMIEYVPEDKRVHSDVLMALVKSLPNVSPYLQLYYLVFPMEIRLRLFVKKRLQNNLGQNESEWWPKGVPEHIRNDCSQRREKEGWRKDLLDYTYLIHLKEILEKRGNWNFFEEDFRRIRETFKSRGAFLSSLVRLNGLRNDVAHPTPNTVPTQDDLNFARHMREVIEQFCGPG